MYENHRGNFGRRPYTGMHDRERRWHRDDPYGRGGWNRDDDRTDWTGYDRNGPVYGGGYGAYGSSYRDSEDDYRGRRTSAWDQARAYGHDDDHHTRPAYGSRYDANEAQQPYFTGQQSSWAVPSVSSYRSGGRYSGYGTDYREHGYTARRDDDNERGFFERAGDEIASWFGDEDAARRREEDHRGRGPSSYIRSDERIREDVNDRLTDDWRVDASNISVTVTDGEVTLDGTVSSRQAKRRAEDVTDAVSGVKHVQNNLRVSETSSSAGGLEQNWALNRSSTAEGGTLGSGKSEKV